MTEAAAHTESLILVDTADREVGHMSKDQCHRGSGILHRAFSLFIFNAAGELLLQQRAAGKRLWPGFWSNSCCSHPRQYESMATAIHRRLQEELGMSCSLHFLFKFLYQAQFDASGAEHELCSVFAGQCSDAVIVNHEEIQAIRWVNLAALETEIKGPGAQRFTPWFLIEWRRIWRDHRAVLPVKP